MKNRVAEYVGFDEGLDLIESPEDYVSSEWLKGLDEEDKELMKLALSSSNGKLILSQIRKFILTKYRLIDEKPVEEKASLGEYLVYREGAKDSLRALHKIMPRPEE